MKPISLPKPNKDQYGKVVDDEAKEPSLPIMVPMNLVRWLIYSACFFTLLIPFNHTTWQWICGALILGWFAGMLNAIINKK